MNPSQDGFQGNLYTSTGEFGLSNQLLSQQAVVCWRRDIESNTGRQVTWRCLETAMTSAGEGRPVQVELKIVLRWLRGIMAWRLSKWNYSDRVQLGIMISHGIHAVKSLIYVHELNNKSIIYFTSITTRPRINYSE